MAMNGELHAAVGVLNAERRAACSEAGERRDLIERETARINLHADLGIGREREVAVEDFRQTIDLAGA
jgi:hypothetical protein